MTQDLAEFITSVPQALGNFQTTMVEEARRYRHEMTVDDITSLDALRRYFSEQTGFVRAKWSGNPASEDMLKDFGATIRCIPYEQSGTAGRCVLTAASCDDGRDIREGILRALRSVVLPMRIRHVTRKSEGVLDLSALAPRD